MHEVVFHEAAELEAAEAVAYYESAEEGLGTALREEVERTVNSIVSRPLAHPVIYQPHVRRAVTHRFPYSIIFTIEDRFILVVAVFHSSRDPMIWKGRIG